MRFKRPHLLDPRGRLASEDANSSVFPPLPTPPRFLQICTPHASLREVRVIPSAVFGAAFGSIRGVPNHPSVQRKNAKGRDAARKPAFCAGPHIQSCPLSLFGLLRGPRLPRLIVIRRMTIHKVNVLVFKLARPHPTPSHVTTRSLLCGAESNTSV